MRNVIGGLGGGSTNAVLKHSARWKAGRPVVRTTKAFHKAGVMDQGRLRESQRLFQIGY